MINENSLDPPDLAATPQTPRSERLTIPPATIERNPAVVLGMLTQVEASLSHSEIIHFLNETISYLKDYPLDPALCELARTSTKAIIEELTALSAQLIKDFGENGDPKFSAKISDLLKQNDSILGSLSPLAKIAIKEWLSYREKFESITEQHLGLLRHDAWKRLIHKLLESGKRGAIVVIDLQGLNTFNKLGHAFGDIALLNTADFCRKIQESLNLSAAECQYLGRKGDEFYLFIPNHEAAALQEKITEMYAAWTDASRYVPLDGDELRKINLYIDIENVDNPDAFYQALDRMDAKVEDKKREAVELYLEEVEKLFGPDIDDKTLYENWQMVFGEDPVDLKNCRTDTEKIDQAAEMIRFYNMPLRCFIALFMQKRISPELLVSFTSAVGNMILPRSEESWSDPLQTTRLQRIQNLFTGDLSRTSPDTSSDRFYTELIMSLPERLHRIVVEMTDPRFLDMPQELHDWIMSRVSSQQMASADSSN